MPDSAVVAVLNTWYVGDVLARSLRCGAFLLDRYYGGDPARFRRRGRKPKSLRGIANHPDLRMSASTVWRMIALAAQDRRLPEEVRPRLTLAQRMVLLPATFHAALPRLSREAVRQDPAPEDLRARVAEALGPSRPGRPPSGPALLMAGRVLRLLREALGALRGARLSAREIAALRTADSAWREAFEQLTAARGAA